MYKVDTKPTTCMMSIWRKWFCARQTVPSISARRRHWKRFMDLLFSLCSATTLESHSSSNDRRADRACQYVVPKIKYPFFPNSVSPPLLKLQRGASVMVPCSDLHSNIVNGKGFVVKGQTTGVTQIVLVDSVGFGLERSPLSCIKFQLSYQGVKVTRKQFPLR